jgi:hypothetical protein
MVEFVLLLMVEFVLLLFVGFDLLLMVGFAVFPVLVLILEYVVFLMAFLVT